MNNSSYVSGFITLPAAVAIGIMVLVVGMIGGSLPIQDQNVQGLEINEKDSETQQPESPTKSTSDLDAESSEQPPTVAPSPVAEATSTMSPKPSSALEQTSRAESTAPTEPNVPLIVHEEFNLVFGRNPTSEESEFWKERFRKNSADRDKIHSWMQIKKDESSQTDTSISVPEQINKSIDDEPATTLSPVDSLTQCAKDEQARGKSGIDCYTAYSALYGSSSRSNLKKFIVEKEIDYDNFLIREYPFGSQYLVEKGVGCISLSFQTIRPFYIEVSGFLDGIGDRIIIPDRNQSCRVWEATAL